MKNADEMLMPIRLSASLSVCLLALICECLFEVLPAIPNSQQFPPATPSNSQNLAPPRNSKQFPSQQFPAIPSSCQQFQAAPSNYQQLPTTPSNSNQLPAIPTNFHQFLATPSYSQQLPANSQQFPASLSNSQQLLATPSNSQQTPSKLPANSQQLPATSQQFQATPSSSQQLPANLVVFSEYSLRSLWVCNAKKHARRYNQNIPR